MIESDYLRDNSSVYSELKSLPLFMDLDSDGFNLLCSISKYRTFQSGETITEQGDFDPWVYILLSGSLSIQVDGEQVASLQERGEIFGEMVLIEEAERSATVIAVEESKCLGIDAVLLEEFDKSIKGLFLADFFQVFARILAERLRQTDEEISLLKKELNNMV